MQDGSEKIVVDLESLARRLGGRAVNLPGPDVPIRAVVFRGSHSIRDSIFVAVAGTAADGHDFIQQAMENGSAAAVVQDEARLAGHPGIVLSDTRAALSKLAAIFAGDPSAQLQLVGVTGTNGKTTIVWLLYHLLNALARPALRIGTLGIRAEGVFDDPGKLTTPDPVHLHECMAIAMGEGVRACAMEVSSHALDQRRVEDLRFDLAIFTNLTRDHLDYHQDMEAYYLAKRRLFDLTAASGKPGAAVVNLDDRYGRRLDAEIAELGLRRFSIGTADDARVRIESFSQNLEGSELELSFDGGRYTISSALIGRHNASNIASSFAACVALGIAPAEVAAAISALPQVPGRLQAVRAGEIGVYVDYAHTPDALENVLATLRELCGGALWVVFGCGGDRDRGKRPVMAGVAERLADKLVVTSDNPRTEDPRTIIADILSGGVKAHLVEPDRRAAIERSLLEARPGDVVLIAGKGHEDYQILGTEKIRFSDAEEAERAVAMRRERR